MREFCRPIANFAHPVTRRLEIGLEEAAKFGPGRRPAVVGELHAEDPRLRARWVVGEPAMTNLAALALGVALIYGAGVATGWTLARRSTRCMLGGKL